MSAALLAPLALAIVAFQAAATASNAILAQQEVADTAVNVANAAYSAAKARNDNKVSTFKSALLSALSMANALNLQAKPITVTLTSTRNTQTALFDRMHAAQESEAMQAAQQVAQQAGLDNMWVLIQARAVEARARNAAVAAAAANLDPPTAIPAPTIPATIPAPAKSTH